MSTLERAIALAATVHSGQRDKAGAPYILHPLRMMMKMTTVETQMAAVLHDVVEDCGRSRTSTLFGERRKTRLHGW
jgi:(p)ppGpp synthase/HD superfamily hydrolase